MATVITWCGLIGVWLLYAGPAYQAALELREFSDQRERVQQISKTIQRERTSFWWWLVPPVHMYLERKRSLAYMHELLTALPDEDVENVLRYHDKAAGWMYVGLGALALAVKETLAYVRDEGWPAWTGFLASFLVFALCIGFVIASTRKTIHLTKRYTSATSRS